MIGKVESDKYKEPLIGTTCYGGNVITMRLNSSEINKPIVIIPFVREVVLYLNGHMAI